MIANIAVHLYFFFLSILLDQALIRRFSGKDGWEGRNLLDMPQPVHHSSGSINMDPATDEPTYFSAPRELKKKTERN